METLTLEEREVTERAAGLWWLFLVTGIAWLVVFWLIFQFDITSAKSISYLFGAVALGAGINEFFAVGASSTGWKVMHLLFGLLFVVVGIIALVNPGETFVAIARLVSFFLLFKGTFDIIAAIATRDVMPAWWLGLIVGIVEILLAFWAAGDFQRKSVLLVAWVAAIALTRGITEIIFAFKLHGLKRELERDDVPPGAAVA